MRKGTKHSDLSKLKMRKSQKMTVNNGRFKSGHKGYKSRQKYKPFSLDNFNDGYVFDGRLIVSLPGHHRANKNGYVFRSIVAYEIYYPDKLITKEFEIHHKNENKFDDSKENLMCLTKAEHRTLHHKGRIKSKKERKRLSVALTGKVLSQKHKDNISIAKRLIIKQGV